MAYHARVLLLFALVAQAAFAAPAQRATQPSITVPLFADLARPGVHMAEITVNGRNTPFRFLVDTTTNAMAVAAAPCQVSCPPLTSLLDLPEGAAECVGDASECEFAVDYGAGFTLSGSVINVTLDIGGNEFPDVEIGAIKEQTSFMGIMGLLVDGVLGVGPPSAKAECVPGSLCLNSIVSQVADTSVVSMCLSDRGGFLTFGEPNKDHYEGDIKYFPMVGQEKKDGYRVAAKSILIADTEVSSGDDVQIRIDTTAEGLRVSPTMFSKIKAAILSTDDICSVQFVCAKDGSAVGVGEGGYEDADDDDEGTIFEHGSCVNFEEADLLKFPEFKIDFGKSISITISGENYFYPQKIEDSDALYFCFAFMSDRNMAAAGDIDMGVAGLEGLFTVLDMEKERVGFSNSAGCEAAGCRTFVGCNDCEAQPLCFWCPTEPSTCLFKDPVLLDSCKDSGHECDAGTIGTGSEPVNAPPDESDEGLGYYSGDSSDSDYYSDESSDSDYYDGELFDDDNSFSDGSPTEGKAKSTGWASSLPDVDWASIDKNTIILGCVAAFIGLLGIVLITQRVRRRRSVSDQRYEAPRNENERLVTPDPWDQDWEE